ncbi:TyrR/PhhR family helix-turn-helix DNA-binding protein [uncultured Microbulbifer sp.]|uniref:TyrR/PhhR family helix-turn-helix DNA-binding protein n=1 Tax=uncultured Microbulbifer sp. TaxID=348147 RepID=UPI0025F9A3FD|nr:TyrR/PhhR family helix-turn-helix DNA-binding protein [uncultured Microbulbifer sp.]
MAIFGEYRVNVTSGELGGDSGDKVYLAAPDMLVAQFQSIERSLYRVPGVEKVRRIDMIPSERRHFELDTLLAHISDPVLSVDREGRIIAANRAAARAFGVSLDQVAGMQLQRFLPRLQLAELLRGFTVPRFGLPVAIRGREYRLDWSPMALSDSPGAADSLAGAVLNLVPAPPTRAGAVLPAPRVLWDFDERREACLRLQQLAPLSDPLLILGERGSGRSTFAAAAFYLSPLADAGEVFWWQGGSPEPWSLEVLAVQGGGVLVIDDLHLLCEDSQRALVAAWHRGALPQRLIVTATGPDNLQPGLRQLLSTQLVTLPALRSLRPAISRFVGAMREESGELLPVTEDALEILKLQDWPTNFAGLAGQLAGASAHARARKASVVDAEDLPLQCGEENLPWTAWGRGLNYRQMMEKMERGLLQELVRGNPSTRALAKKLGLSHTAIANKLRKYGLGHAERDK